MGTGCSLRLVVRHRCPCQVVLVGTHLHAILHAHHRIVETHLIWAHLTQHFLLLTLLEPVLMLLVQLVTGLAYIVQGRSVSHTCVWWIYWLI